VRACRRALAPAAPASRRTPASQARDPESVRRASRAPWRAPPAPRARGDPRGSSWCRAPPCSSALGASSSSVASLRSETRRGIARQRARERARATGRPESTAAVAQPPLPASRTPAPRASDPIRCGPADRCSSPIRAVVASTSSVYEPAPANATTTRWNGPTHWNEPTSGMMGRVEDEGKVPAPAGRTRAGRKSLAAVEGQREIDVQQLAGLERELVGVGRSLARLTDDRARAAGHEVSEIVGLVRRVVRLGLDDRTRRIEEQDRTAGRRASAAASPSSAAASAGHEQRGEQSDREPGGRAAGVFHGLSFDRERRAAGVQRRAAHRLKGTSLIQWKPRVSSR
jgi:hypothetical protein